MYFTQIPIIEIILGSIAFIIILAFGLAVYLKNPKSHTNILFFVLALVLNAYIVATAIALHPIIKTLESNLFWIRVDMFLGSFIAPILFLLAHTFPKNKITLSKKWLKITAGYTLIMAVISFTDLIFKSVGYPNGSITPVPVPGDGMAFYFIHIVGYFTASFVVLINHYKKSLGSEKVKMLYFLIGIIATFTGMAIVDFLLVLLGNTSLVYMGPLFPVFLMALVGIAIVKHQFLDIKPLIARTVSYIFLLMLLAGGYFLLLFFGFTKFLGITPTIYSILINVSLGVIVALTFQPIRSFVIKATDKVFFKGMYDTEKILSDLTHAISSTINFNDLANNLLETITKELRVGKAGIFIISGNEISDARSIGYTNSTLLDDPKLFEFLTENKEKHFFVINELDQNKKDFFHTHDVEALFPIKAEGTHVAVLVLGTKLSGLPYSKTDLNLLDVFASESGVAIQNSKLYTNLKLALESKTRFISVVSHQLRTPISGIRWSLETLKMGGSVEHQHELINTSHQKVVFLNEQLDDILIALDIYDKKLSLNKAQCDILDVCKKIVTDFENELTTNNLKITYAITHNTGTIEADFNKLKKIMEVLIKNAILYSYPGGEINIDSKHQIHEDKNCIFITVKDSGMGITPTEKGRVFEEFYRSERAKIKVPDGLGLGMFIAQTFAHAHDGNILIDSSGADRGSCITLVLPTI